MENETQKRGRKYLGRPNKSLVMGLLVGLLIGAVGFGGIATATGRLQTSNTSGEVENIAPSALNITDTQARDAVTAAYPDATIQSLDLDAESGTLVYDAELDNGTEVMVDAATGDVLGVEQDDDDPNGDEDDDEGEIGTQGEDEDEVGDVDQGGDDTEGADQDD